mmetsp:Transcript_22813/g.58063  ORF Transcript_22813/g.58063 Transcript_22813/m.58063 type:complete len:213 (+) Transcript_22813:65-703(+)
MVLTLPHSPLLPLVLFDHHVLGINDRPALLHAPPPAAAAAARAATAPTSRRRGASTSKHVGKRVACARPLLRLLLRALGCAPLRRLQQRGRHGDRQPPHNEQQVERAPEQRRRHDGQQHQQQRGLAIPGGGERVQLRAPHRPLLLKVFGRIAQPPTHVVRLVHVFHRLLCLLRCFRCLLLYFVFTVELRPCSLEALLGLFTPLIERLCCFVP